MMSDVMEQNVPNVELNAVMPREQMEIAPDSTHLSDAALLAILLKTGAPGLNVMELSELVLEVFGSLKNLVSGDWRFLEARINDWNATHPDRQIKGVGHVKCLELAAAFEIARRWDRLSVADIKKVHVDSPEKAYEALVRRLGEDCVYLNSKYKRPDGAEKELWDIFVLALPYAVVFQMKWRDRSANDFVGERGCVEAKRLDKKMSEAAKQFREFLTLYDNHATIRLPRVWRQQSGDYELPLDFIEKIIPVVVIDFDDPDYANPDLRMCLRPRVSDVPNRVKPFGTVHSFLFKDLLRIVDQMFTIGDLVTYLMKRREMLETGVAFVQYSEMDMFALYQTDYPLWEKLVGNSAVVIEPGIFEAKTAKHKEKFAQRQQFFTTPDLIDGLIDEVVHSDVEDMACLQNLGRLRLMTSVMKKDVSKVLMQNIRLFSLPRDAQVCGMRRSIGNYASEIMPGTYICVVVFNGMPSHMIAVASYCYLRTLRRIEELQKKDEAKEVFIIMASAITPASYVELKQILDEDYGLAPSQEEIEASRFDCSERKVKASEWGYLEDNGVRDLE